jgi:hypothetical protein
MKIRFLPIFLYWVMTLSSVILPLLLMVSLAAEAQQASGDPAANAGRPTVSTPATLTPVGYLQFETGYLYATQSPELSSQSSFNEVAKLSVARRLQLLVGSEPFARSVVADQPSDAAGGISLGAQGVVYPGEGVRPTVALSYFRQIYGGNTPDLDVGSALNSSLLLISADVKGFHYDTNYLFNEVTQDAVHRIQFGQTLSISHSVARKFGVTGEMWRFSQPFLRANAIGNLWALNYNLNNHLVLDCGFNRGLTTTSTRWEVFTGFTYLLPHRILR